MAHRDRALLSELLTRLRSSPRRSIDMTSAELDAWPQDDVLALKGAGILIQGSAALSVECPGCEQGCAMLVESEPRPGRPPLIYVVCDKRDDIAMVPLRAADVERWRVTEAGLAVALSRLLGGAATSPGQRGANGFRLGVVTGRRDKGATFLRWNDYGAVLSLAGHDLDLALVLSIEAAKLTLDMSTLRRAVDSPSGAPIEDEPPDERRQRYLDLVKAARQRNPGKFLQAVADQEGITIYALKQVVYRKQKPKPAMAAMAHSLANPVPKKAERKR